MAPPQPVPPPRERPADAFEKLRQAFDVLKSNHTDPWCWHEYLREEKVQEPEEEEEEDEDIERFMLRPKARKTVDRLKSHLLATISELNRAAQAADLCYFHMCCSPQDARDCAIILGTGGDVDGDMLRDSGDGSPAKIMALMQAKLNEAKANIDALTEEVQDLKDQLVDNRAATKEITARWEQSAMAQEEAIARFAVAAAALRETEEREHELQAAYDDVYRRLVRASRLMLHKGREAMRDRILHVNRKETLFYSFQGFIFVLQKEKEERIQRELEEKRNAIEFALRNEVAFLLRESARRMVSVERLTVEVGRLKLDRRRLGAVILYKYRPYLPLEYCLWVWELWQSIRKELILEKRLETEQATRASAVQQLNHTSSMLPPLTKRIGQLRIELANEKIAHDVSRKELMAAGARQAISLVQKLREHRAKELEVLARLHQLDVEAKQERIAVLEKELAEDTHVQALKGMVVELESHLRRALDHRKQRPFAVPPAGQKCVQCQREMLFRNWRCTPLQGVAPALSDADLAVPGLGPLSGSKSLTALGPLAAAVGQSLRPGAPWGDKKASYAAVWR